MSVATDAVNTALLFPAGFFLDRYAPATEGRLVRVLRGCWMLAAFFVMSSCGRGAPPPLAETPPTALIEIPAPDLATLEPHVQHQFETAQAQLDDALSARPLDPAELGRLFGEQGQLYFAYSFDEAARACFLNAQTLAAQDYRWPYYLGRLLHKAGDAEASRLQFERALALDPAYAPTYLALADLHIEANRLEEAERLLNEVLKKNPESAAARFGLGRIAARRNDHAQAVAHLEAARRLDPAATEINYPLGLAYRAQGDVEKARYFLERRGAVKIRVADPLMSEITGLASGGRAYQMMGNEAYLQGLYPEAVAAYVKALDADSANVDVRLNLGAVLLQVNNLEGAEEQFLHTLRIEPDNARALFSIGTLRARQHQDQEAAAYYRQAVASDPDYTDAHFNLANAMLRLHRFDEAQAHFLRVAELDPRNGTARHGYAAALIHRGRWQEAHDWLKDSHAQLPEDPLVANTLARMLAACPVDALRDGPRALEIAQGLVQAERSLSNVEALAMALAEVGRFEEAATLQQDGLAAAQRAGRHDLAAALTTNLAHYREARPSRTPLPRP